MILAGKRQTLIASKKNAVEVPTLPLDKMTVYDCHPILFLPGHDVGGSELWKRSELLGAPALVTSRARQRDPRDKASGGKADAIFLPVLPVISFNQVSNSGL